MAQQIRLNEDQLKSMIMEAINEEMQEGYFGNLLKRGINNAVNAGKQAAQNIKNDYQGYRALGADERQAKSDMKAANRTNKGIAKNISNDIAALDAMMARYQQVYPRVANSINMAKSQLNKAAQMASQNAQNAQANYNTQKAAANQARANYKSGNMQPQAQPAMNEQIDRIVGNLIKELSNKQ